MQSGQCCRPFSRHFRWYLFRLTGSTTASGESHFSTLRPWKITTTSHPVCRKVDRPIHPAHRPRTTSPPITSGSWGDGGPLDSLGIGADRRGIVGSRPARHRYCRCGTHLAADNPGRQCARCQRVSRDKLIAPPQVPTEFWQTKQFRDAFAAQHIGRIARAYRTHPYHHAVYGPDGISQTLLGQWIGLRQPQISRIETGPPIRNLDTLVYWARVLRISAELLWFRLPDEQRQRATMEPAASHLAELNNALELPAEPHSPGMQPASNTSDEHADDPERDPVLSCLIGG